MLFTNSPSAGTFDNAVIEVMSLRDRVPDTPAPAAQPPTRVANLSATGHTRDTFTLTWTDAQGETSYDVLLSSDGGKTFQKVGTTAANATQFTVGGLKPYTTYYAKVVSASAAGRVESVAVRVRTA